MIRLKMLKHICSFYCFVFFKDNCVNLQVSLRYSPASLLFRGLCVSLQVTFREPHLQREGGHVCEIIELKKVGFRTSSAAVNTGRALGEPQMGRQHLCRGCVRGKSRGCGGDTEFKPWPGA